ncbi:MAG: WYL domain-containing protein [Microcystis aeruginosa LL13-03]|nr:WYL domain-containing protein [Microcystis aeruginosa LL13-03]NCR46388.1 WYL domain-containing protein [Microcystis aeruginosa SX13-01]NCR65561.1 WYL domain-containing protein [Microcystis aeruginosa LL11-07]
MNANLQENPPESNEGLLKIYPVPIRDNSFDIDGICKILTGFKRLSANIANLNKNKVFVFHQYSYLLDFDRLMHLIFVIINYPGIGNLAETEPENLREILEVEELPQFSTSIEEICAVITKKYHAIYAHPEAIEKDLDWLEKNGFLAKGDIAADLIDIETIQVPDVMTHRYSNLEQFERLIKTIRFIIHRPFLNSPIKKTQKFFIEKMLELGLFDENKYSLNMLRKDIEFVLNPYQILPEISMKKGYFAGTGILSQYELNKLYESLKAHCKQEFFQDPMAVEIYNILQYRLTQSRLIQGKETYPIYSMGTKSIVNIEPHQDKFKKIEEAIREYKSLQCYYVKGSPTWQEGESNYFGFEVYPLQIIFHNIAWYLGYEQLDGLLRFERIDRLNFSVTEKTREAKTQRASLENLKKLYTASVGLLLGSVEEQQKFLKNSDSELTTVVIHAQEDAFKFICEGNQRFTQIKMTKPDWNNEQWDTSIFNLGKNSSPYPYTLKITLPKWSVFDIDLIRWISVLGKKVKVISPQSLIDKIYSIGEGITNIYQDIELICCDLEKVNDLVKNKEGSDYRFISIKTPNGNAEPQSVQSELNMNPGHIHLCRIDDITQFNEEDIKKTVAFIKKKKKASKIQDGLRFLIYSHSGINLASEVAIAIYRELKQDTELTNLRISLSYL